jgi:hypothetical protein
MSIDLISLIKTTSKFNLMTFKNGILFGLIMFVTISTHGQQFNSDSYISKPHGMATIILTTGQRNTMFMNTFSLFPRWEFTAAAYIYRSDFNHLTDDGYSLSFYAKYMFYENEAKTGGFSMKAGKGLDPGYLDGDQKVKDASETYWTNAPITLPFFDNKLSWDLMPGLSLSKKYEETTSSAWAFTWSTRLAYYPVTPLWSLVGETFGSAGQVKSTPEFRTGFRWEPNQYVNIALSYGSKFNGDKGAGWEIGAMLFSPPFLCLHGCK